jgi:hypothetical protein
LYEPLHTNETDYGPTVESFFLFGGLAFGFCFCGFLNDVASLVSKRSVVFGSCDCLVAFSYFFYFFAFYSFCFFSVVSRVSVALTFLASI